MLEQGGPGHTGQQATVRRRSEQAFAFREPQVRPAGLEHVTIQVHKQRRAAVGAQLLDQSAVEPLVRAEAASEEDRFELDHGLRLAHRVPLEFCPALTHADPQARVLLVLGLSAYATFEVIGRRASPSA